MSVIVYALCTIAALLCAVLLFRSYARNRSPLLLWTGLCFAMLTVNNLIVAVDVLLAPQIDLYTLRLVAGIAAVAVLLYGLVWESSS